MTPTIKSINGPVIKARNASDLKIREMVTVGKLKLIGEVVSIDGDYAIIQVYEDTSGLKINDEIIKTNRPLSVRLGPGMIGNMFDGIQRPLDKIALNHGSFIPSGLGLSNLDEEKKWDVKIKVKVGNKIKRGQILLTCQRVLDIFFPVAKGGTVAIPGGFGTGKTMLQHQLAQYSNADIIIYIGCGERGNEMTQVLEDFPNLIDPNTGRGLMERTILIANTSNMPVAAREASIYTGITMAEYFRDMGYDVALMADSTSRWAEALREISARLEEIPAEEGYPAILAHDFHNFMKEQAIL